MRHSERGTHMVSSKSSPDSSGGSVPVNPSEHPLQARFLQSARFYFHPLPQRVSRIWLSGTSRIVLWQRRSVQGRDT